MVHPLLIVFPLLASIYCSYFYIKLFIRKTVPEYYCVMDKVSISGFDLTFYYSIAYVIWVLVLSFSLYQSEGNYTEDMVRTYVFVNINRSLVLYYSVYCVYYYHGLINLFCILVSLDTYNEFKEFCFNCTFALISNQIYICWIFTCILPDTPWIYLTFCGIIICIIICVKGMKENFEEEDRMYKELRKAKYGRTGGRAPPKISKRFKEDDDFGNDIDADNVSDEDDDDMDMINQQIYEAERNEKERKDESSEY